MTLVAVIKILAALAGTVSAILWLISATRRVTPAPQMDEEGWESATIVTSDERKETDFIRTVELQSRWNAKAAWAAAIAAGLTAMAMFLEG